MCVAINNPLFSKNNFLLFFEKRYHTTFPYFFFTFPKLLEPQGIYPAPSKKQNAKKKKKTHTQTTAKFLFFSDLKFLFFFFPLFPLLSLSLVFSSSPTTARRWKNYKLKNKTKKSFLSRGEEDSILFSDEFFHEHVYENPVGKVPKRYEHEFFEMESHVVRPGAYTKCASDPPIG